MHCAGLGCGYSALNDFKEPECMATQQWTSVGHEPISEKQSNHIHTLKGYIANGVLGILNLLNGIIKPVTL